MVSLSFVHHHIHLSLPFPDILSWEQDTQGHTHYRTYRLWQGPLHSSIGTSSPRFNTTDFNAFDGP